MKEFTAKTNTNYLHSETTGAVLQAFYAVCNKLGYGFETDVYKKTMALELESVGLICDLNKTMPIMYGGSEIGKFEIDILVDNKVSLLVIVSEQIERKDEVKLMNQLKQTDIEVGLILNFYIEGEHKRKVFTNSIKKKY